MADALNKDYLRKLRERLVGTLARQEGVAEETRRQIAALDEMMKTGK